MVVIWGCFWVHFEVDFESFWALLEVIFGSLRPPGTPLVSWFTPGGPQDPPRRVRERLLGPSGADFGPTWRERDFSGLKNALFSEGILDENRRILDPTCLQKALLSNIEVFSRSPEGCEAREPHFYSKNDRFLVKNCTNSTSKISKIRYYSSSKWIFDFFEEIARKSRFWPHLGTHFWHF